MFGVAGSYFWRSVHNSVLFMLYFDTSDVEQTDSTAVFATALRGKNKNVVSGADN